MDQIEMVLFNTDKYLSANGYNLGPKIMTPRIEARFGALMMMAAMKPNEFGQTMFCKKEKRFPKTLGYCVTPKTEAIRSRDLISTITILRSAEGNGTNSRKLSKVIGITRTAARARIMRRVRDGYLREFGYTSGETGGVTKTYVLTIDGSIFLRGNK